MEKLKGYISSDEAAEILGVSRAAVHNYIREGKLNAVLAGGKLMLIPLDEFEAKKHNLVCEKRCRKFETCVTVNIKFEKTTRDRLTEMAQARGVSASEVVREAVIKYIEEAK